MGIHFPDLQVLLPRADELARAGSPAQQQDTHQLALAQAAAVRQERERQRIVRSRETTSSGGLRRERQGQHRSDGAQVLRHPGKGRRIDIDA